MASRSRRAHRNAHAHGPGFAILVVMSSLCVLMVVGAISVVSLVDSWLSDLPDYTDADAFATAEPTTILANDGTVLASLYLENRDSVTQDEVADYVFEATVATEDVRFYEHDGVDYQGIARAVLVNLASGSTSEGASTITQQYIRNTILLDEMTDISLKRKVREAYLALEIEKIYTKDEILMMYLNTIYYGEGAYGIQAAAQTYFNKDAADLTLAESALLAGIPQSPTALNPYNDLEAATERRNTVLARMLSAGYITQSEYDEAVAEAVTLDKSAEESDTDGIYSSPYFVSYVKGLLSEQFSDSTIFQGGLTVYTTLDPDLQADAEASAADALEGQDEDLEVSITSVDPDTGYILAMVGGRNYEEDQFNLATQARRQAGSSFKTFTLVTALKEGISPSTKFDASSPAVIDTNPTWTVSNSEGSGTGYMTLSKATRLSVNTVYARLSHELGAEAIVETCEDMGITSDLNAVESIALGTQGVCTLEMASAYGTLATGGVHHDTVAITKVEDRDGNIVYESEDVSTQAISEEVAYAATKVLEGVITSGTGTRAELDNGQVAAGKTGTSQNNRDVWFVGYTPQLSTAIWVGYREEQTIYYNGVKAYGGTVCAPIWKQFMTAALEGAENEEFPTADNPVYDNELNEQSYDDDTDAETSTETSTTDTETEPDTSTETSTTETETDPEPEPSAETSTTEPSDETSGSGN